LELYFRINGVILRLPPLRDRKEDIRDLLECFLVKHANELRKNVPEVNREARKIGLGIFESWRTLLARLLRLVTLPWLWAIFA
jgi:transcriptional regulator with PAS, ATPase and Fis domain